MDILKYGTDVEVIKPQFLWKQVHLNQLKSRTILDEELFRLLSILKMETVKEEKKSSFDYLLRKVELTPGQAVLIAGCDPVQYSIDLQYTLKRYINILRIENIKKLKKTKVEHLIGFML
jgi:hypothetical protein